VKSEDAQSIIAIVVALVGALVFSSDALAAKIYHCRAYSGGEFFSTGPCGQQQSLGLGVYSVPDGMPFNQQVDLVRQRLGQSANAQARDDQELARNNDCSSIKRQLEDLAKKYSSGRYVPVDEVNADQTKEWQLKQRRSSLRCY
jgi:hypothetical protein